MQIVVRGVANRLSELGVDIKRKGWQERLEAAIRQRVPDELGWSYSEDEDVLVVDLPDLPIPDLRFGEVVEVRYARPAG